MTPALLKTMLRCDGLLQALGLTAQFLARNAADFGLEDCGEIRHDDILNDLAMREAMQRTNEQYRNLLSKDSGALAGLLFEVGSN
jgi:hypothetical protein